MWAHHVSCLAMARTWVATDDVNVCCYYYASETHSRNAYHSNPNPVVTHSRQYSKISVNSVVANEPYAPTVSNDILHGQNRDNTAETRSSDYADHASSDEKALLPVVASGLSDSEACRREDSCFRLAWSRHDG
jgi:hypothetical protein